MKTLFTTAIVAATVAFSGGSAYAASSAYCAQVAQNYVNNYTHPAGAAVAGCVGGGLLMNIITKGNGAATGAGCVAGGATGLVLSDAKRKQLYDQAYYDCMNKGGAKPVLQPTPVAGPPPSGTAVVTVQLNVRTGPSTANPVIGVLPQYSTVGVIACTPGWCQVDVTGGPGWASRSYLSFQ
jgi:uncharacterized protein YgiM (DUF1202 family)